MTGRRALDIIALREKTVAETFVAKLLKAARRQDSWLCLGLDPQPELMPLPDVVEFNRAIIEATGDQVCAYKLNLAFYEALGMEGLEALRKTLAHIPRQVPVIGDGKRSDIGPSAQAYARALFSLWSFDAATVSPYMGYDSIAPFLEWEDKGVFLLCHTSNPGAQDFQKLTSSEGQALYQIVARKAVEWNRAGNLGLVMGATYPQELRWVRQLCPDMPLLIPGIGPQGGDLETAVRAGANGQGEMAIIVSARQVLYSSRGRDFPQAARQTAMRLREEINRCRGG